MNMLQAFSKKTFFGQAGYAAMKTDDQGKILLLKPFLTYKLTLVLVVNSLPENLALLIPWISRNDRICISGFLPLVKPRLS